MIPFSILDQAPIRQGGAAAQAFRQTGSGLDKARALQCLSMAVYYEAASESHAGQQAVAQVARNRVAHPAYPASVCGVVFQGSERTSGCQFSFTCDGSLGRRPSRRGWAVAQSVALAALVLIALTIAWFSRERIADDVIQGQLDQYDLPAPYDIESIGPNRQV